MHSEELLEWKWETCYAAQNYFWYFIFQALNCLNYPPSYQMSMAANGT